MLLIRKMSLLTLVMLSWFFTSTLGSYAATITAGSCSYADVSTAISSASSGDIVSVPSGTCIWDNASSALPTSPVHRATLYITKGITLQGAGVGNTVISVSIGNQAFPVAYIPANPALNELFRLTGFTFNLNSTSLALYFKNTSSASMIDKVRVDHNSFLNCLGIGPNFVAFNIYGPIGAVIDNNEFTGSPVFHIYGIGQNSWNNTPFVYGMGNNIYIEDNNFISDMGIAAGQSGGSYVARYNSYTFTKSGSYDLSPWFDAHGNSGLGGLCNYYGMLGVEIYGNSLTLTNIGSGVRSFHHRGGKALFYFNKIVNATTNYASIKVEEEWSDSYCPTANPIPQHVSDSFYWNNRNGINPFTLSVANAITDPPLTYQLVENKDFYNQQSSFNGTSGMGCGPLASRPSTCTAGVGYWATDQSCSDLTGMVGANPSTPISGALYKCTAPNKWTLYYQPYTYPHPLRGEAPIPIFIPPSSGTQPNAATSMTGTVK